MTSAPYVAPFTPETHRAVAHPRTVKAHPEWTGVEADPECPLDKLYFLERRPWRPVYSDDD